VTTTVSLVLLVFSDKNSYRFLVREITSFSSQSSRWICI